MRIAVTGGCGFIGSHVVDHLIRGGHEVAVLDIGRRWRNPGARYRQADIFDAGGPRRHGVRRRRRLPPGRGRGCERGRRRPGDGRPAERGGHRARPGGRRPGGRRPVRAGQHGVGVRGGRRPGRADRGRAGGPAQPGARLRGHQAGRRAARAQLPGDVRAALHDLAVRHPVRPADARRAGRRQVRPGRAGRRAHHHRRHRRAAAQLRLRRGPGRRARPCAGAGRGRSDPGAGRAARPCRSGRSPTLSAAWSGRFQVRHEPARRPTTRA